MNLEGEMQVATMAVFTALLTVTGCSANVKMSRLAPSALENGSTVKGVILYQPMLAELTYSFTIRVDKDGKIVGSVAERTCVQTVQRVEVSLIADLERPFLIQNASGWFSAAKFSVALNNGLLASVNVEPTQKVSDVLSATSTLVKEFGALGAPVDPGSACNAGPILTAITRATVSE